METHKTHYREHVNRTHLSSINIELMQQRGHDLIFTITQSYHSFTENVNGKVDPKGTYVSHLDGAKLPLVLNSTNRQTMVKLAKDSGMSIEDAEYAENWVGMKIQLFVDNSVKSRYGNKGIRISPVLVQEIQKPEFEEHMFESAREQEYTIEMIEQHYNVTEEIKTKYLELWS